MIGCSSFSDCFRHIFGFKRFESVKCLCSFIVMSYLLSICMISINGSFLRVLTIFAVDLSLCTILIGMSLTSSMLPMVLPSLIYR